MTSGHKIVQGAAFSSAGTIVSMAGAMGAAMIFTRVLPEAHVGVFSLLVLTNDLLILCSNLGMRSGLPKLVASAAEQDRPSLVSSALGFQLLISSMAGGGIYLFWFVVRDPTAVSSNANWVGLYPYLWLLPLLSLAAAQRDVATASLAGLNRYGRRAVGGVVAASVNVGLVAVLVWGLQGGLLALILAVLASHVAAGAWLYGSLPAGCMPGLRWRPYRDAVAFSWPLYVNNMLTFVFQRLDTFLVAWMLGPVNVAYYEMAKRLPNMANRVLAAVLVPYLPSVSARIAGQDLAGASRLMNKALGLVAFLGYTGVLCTVTIQELLIRLLFSADYLPATRVLWLLMTALCLHVQVGILGQSIIAFGRPGVIAAINVGTALVSIAANLVLIPRFGILGAGCSYLLAIGFAGILHTGFTRRCGLRMDILGIVKPQVLMALSLTIMWLGHGAFAGRVAATGLFVALCFAASVVSVAQMVDMAKALGLRRPGAR